MSQTFISFAQNIEITVLNRNSMPLPYAYILINNKPVEVTDTSGIANISLNKLIDNDTISVSYLGASPARIIFNNTIKESKKYCFYLDETGFKLNEVIVTYQDNEKIFKKNIKNIPPLNYNCRLNANFSVLITYPNQQAKTVTGTFEAINDFKFTPKFWNWFAPPIKLNTKSDTTNIYRSLNYHIQAALNFSNITIWKWQSNQNTKPIYSYLGEKGNDKIFRLVYPKTFIDAFYYQVIIYVDKDSKYLRSVNIDAFNDDPAGNLHKFSITFDCKIFTSERPKKNPICLLDNINYRYQIVNKSQYDLIITDSAIDNVQK